MYYRFIQLLITCIINITVYASAEPKLDHIDIDLTDKSALQDGLKIFVNYCMGCHSTKFQRYEKVAKDLDIPINLMQEKLIFSDAKISDLMTIGMKQEDAKNWFGTVPPDLTLIARIRGPDWLYTYLRSFYEDLKRPLGVNNIIFPNVGMPNVLEKIQGKQIIGCKQIQTIKNGKKQFDPLTGTQITHEDCNQLIVIPETAKFNTIEFNEMIKNLVSFLVYSSDPNRLISNKIGLYVLFYLTVLLIFTYLLKKVFWKNL